MTKPKMKSDHPVDNLLADWGSWCRKESRSFLGYAQIKYSELVSRSQSTDNTVFVDEKVVALDKLIHKILPTSGVYLLFLSYVQMLPDKRACFEMKMSRSEFGKMRNMFVMPALRKAWDENMSVQQNASTYERLEVI